jgi:hypothetical protein
VPIEAQAHRRSSPNQVVALALSLSLSLSLSLDLFLFGNVLKYVDLEDPLSHGESKLKKNRVLTSHNRGHSHGQSHRLSARHMEDVQKDSLRRRMGLRHTSDTTPTELPVSVPETPSLFITEIALIARLPNQAIT